MKNLSLCLIPLFLLTFNSALIGQKQSYAKDLNPPPPPACGGAVGINLNPEGYFGSGTANISASGADLSADYGYSLVAPPPPGSYTLTNNTASWITSFPNPTWIKIGDNSPDPNGYMMVINGQEDKKTFVEWEIDGLCPGINYEFAADFINLIDSTLATQGFPKIDFLVNGLVLGSTADIPQDEQWHSIGFTFTPDAVQSSLTIGLRNNTSTNTGNDFAIDNVLLRPCGPSLEIAEVMPTEHCLKDVVEIALGIGTGPNDPVIQWQMSQNEGENWEDFGGPSNLTSLVIPSLPANLALRALVAENIDHLASPSCRYISNALTFSYLPIESCPSTLIDTTICAGELVRVGGSDFNTTGTYQVLLVDHLGADSLVQLTLTVRSPIVVEKNIGICSGDSYEGLPYEKDTTLMSIAPAANGCDSVTIFHLFILPSPAPQIIGPTAICEGKLDQLIVNGGNFIAYEWSTGETNRSLTINKPGQYSVTVSDDSGCIGEQTWAVLETAISADYSVIPPTCAVSADGIIAIEAIRGGSGNYTVRLDGKTIPETSAVVNAGTFRLQITDSKGCTFEENISVLPAEPLLLVFDAEHQINIGQSIPLSVSSNRALTRVQWLANAELSCLDCLEPLATPEHTTRYELLVEDDRGCTTEAQITVIVKQQFAIYTPNVFSPNGDGINDFFTLYGGDELSKIIQLKIFDRWGAVVYTSNNLNLGEQAWDGTFQGQLLPAGVYVYQVEVMGQQGRVERVLGEVALVR
ncbi:MAG: gliding motility-associated C-terminal domain-containing protein [Saprospiraceae bacterium]